MDTDTRNQQSDDATRRAMELSKQDAASRRRHQNRVNQRASRKRKALQAEKQGRTRERRWIIYTEPVCASPEHKGTTVASSTQLEQPSPIQNYGKAYKGVSNQMIREKYWAQLKAKVAAGAANKVQSPDLLLPVAQFNIMRATFENATTMGLTWDILSEDIASYFNIAGPVTLRLPPSLEPSGTQRSIVHHPWIDLIPVPSLRDALLLQIDEYDEDQLCGDLYGICGPSPEVGLLVWGEAWDPSAYEVSERVFNKWGRFLRGCPELLKSTNYWRRKRGEKQLRLPDLRDSCVEEIKD
ncbi:uncharacterized protein N7498_000679 [Penicillium cinerascens]|uniref:BZIP domain-containing protein n=1 Tax=Penicillium cinerascens TaxID=70096 RepID=A0A9W9NET8_9EURO|nr:uncharacterized protein N7498_000679 [Penicillium cinerascens]KAJ5218580.1 hypothetical protein N7498_000679 [Penicillium cinerascens]